MYLWRDSLLRGLGGSKTPGTWAYRRGAACRGCRARGYVGGRAAAFAAVANCPAGVAPWVAPRAGPPIPSQEGRLASLEVLDISFTSSIFWSDGSHLLSHLLAQSSEIAMEVANPLSDATPPAFCVVWGSDGGPSERGVAAPPRLSLYLSIYLSLSLYTYIYIYISYTHECLRTQGAWRPAG